MVIVAHSCESTKSHRAVHFKEVSLMVYDDMPIKNYLCLIKGIERLTKSKAFLD